jgi:hypothetical protein
MNLRLTPLCLLTFAALCCANASAQYQQYPSTTSVNIGTDSGDIYAYSSISWSGDCDDPNDGLANSALYLNNDTQIFVYGDDSGAEFDSEEDFGLIFGPGSYTAYGSWNGFGNNDEQCTVEGSSGSASLVIPSVAAVLTLTPSPATVPEGQKLVVTASVSGVTGYNQGPIPTGSVILFYGSTILASSSLSGVTSTGPIASSATFSLSTAGVPPGNYTLSIAYSGDANLNGTTTPLQVTVTNAKVSTATGLTAAPNPVTAGKSLTLTATVTSSGVTPTGMVTFLVGTTSIGTAKLNSSGVATLTESTSGIPAGVYAVHASYGGDAFNYASVSSAQNVTVQATTATTLTANPTTVTEGQTVNLTAKVARTGNSGTPTGTVAFQFGGYTLATATLSSGTATAGISTKNLSPGSYPLTAVYNGDTLDAKSNSNTVTITVQ